MSAIGILGGMGPEASTHLLTLLVQGIRQRLPNAIDSDFPRIVLLNVPVPNFVENKRNIEPAKRILIENTKLLEQSGCTVNGIACNTAHILLPDLQAITKVPFLSIPNFVAQKIKACGFERVGLLATPTTLSSTLYDEALDGISQLIRPSKSTVVQVEKFIFKQLNASLLESEQEEFRSLVKQFQAAEKLDAVILGCTELPLIFGGHKDPSVINTLQVLADGLLDNILGKPVMEPGLLADCPAPI